MPVEADPSFIDQALQQSHVRGGEIIVRSGAIDQPVDAQMDNARAAAKLDLGVDAIGEPQQPFQPAGDMAQPARPDQGAQFRADGRGDAMAMRVPPGADMANEAGLLRRRKAAPQRLRERPQAIQNGLPALSSDRAFAIWLRTCRTSRRTERASSRSMKGFHSAAGSCVRGRSPWREIGDDFAAMAARVKRQRDIDHRQPGAEQQHGFVGRNRDPGPRDSTGSLR